MASHVEVIQTGSFMDPFLGEEATEHAVALGRSDGAEDATSEHGGAECGPVGGRGFAWAWREELVDVGAHGHAGGAI